MALPAIVSSAGRFLATQTARKVLSGSSNKKDSNEETQQQSNKNIRTPKNNQGTRINSLSFFGSSPSQSNNFQSVSSKGGSDDSLNTIQEKVIKIEKLLKNSFILTKKEEEKNRKKSETQTRKKKEEELETKTKEEKENKFAIPIPGKGLIDGLMGRIYNFIFWVTIGKILPTLIKFKPLLIGVVKVLSTIVNGAIDIFGFILDGFITFVDFGFKVWDSVRGIAKFIGGENLVGVLDGLTNAITTMMNLAIIAAMLSIGSDGDGPGRRPRKGKKGTPSRPGTGGRPKVTTSGGRSAGPLGGIRDRLTRPFQRGPEITTSGGRSAGPLGGIKDRLTRPFQRRPKVTTSGGKTVGGLFEGIGKFGSGALEAIKKFGAGASDLYKKTVSKFSEKIGDLSKKGKDAILGWMSKQSGVIGKLGKAAPDLIKKLGKYVPFVGDVINFVFDIIQGIDWRRALIRAVTGATIDAGFTALMAGLGLATPFTGGTSGILATAIYAAYMAADITSGGFGNILGDKISDFLKLPVKAGEKGKDAPAPSSPGSDADIKKVQQDIAKKRAEDKEFNSKISSFENKGTQPPKKSEDTEKKFTGGIIQGFESGGTIAPPRKKVVTRVDPGKDVGGKDQILKLFPDYKEKKAGGIFGILSGLFKQTKQDATQLPSALSSLKKTIEILKKIPFVGELMAAGIQIAIGQRPDKSVFDMLFGSMKFLISKITSLENSDDISSLSKEIQKLSSGGLSEASSIKQSDIIDSEKITKSFSSAISFAADRNINLALLEIRNEIEKSQRSQKSYDEEKKRQEEEKKKQEEQERLRREQEGAVDSSDAGIETAKGAVSASELYKQIGANAEQWDIFRNSIALIESKGDYKVFGGSGKHYDGRYQMGEAAKKDGSKVAGVLYPGHSSDPNSHSRVSFRNNPQLQETIFTGYTIANHRYLMGNKKYASSSIERKLQILGYAHNQGMGGAENWLNTGQVGADGFGTKGTKYTDLIAKNFKAKKSGGKLELASGSINVPESAAKDTPRTSVQTTTISSSSKVFHPDTGGGYSGGQTDQQGRPIVLSKYAADAFRRMVQDSGMNLGASVASSGRSVAKNSTLSGSDPNSHHLYGEAMDMNGAGFEWVKKHGKKYGWQYGYNHGPGSAHFKYVGPGAGVPPKLAQSQKELQGYAFHGGLIAKEGIYKLHNGEFIIDKDTVDLLGKDFFKSLNSVENNSTLKKIGPTLTDRINESIKSTSFSILKTNERYTKKGEKDARNKITKQSDTIKNLQLFNKQQDTKTNESYRPSITDTLSELREMRSRSLERQGREPEANILRSYGTNTINLFNKNNKVDYNFKPDDQKIDYQKLMNASFGIKNSSDKENISQPKTSFDAPLNFEVPKITFPSKIEPTNYSAKEPMVQKEDPNLYKLDPKNIQKFKGGGLVGDVSKYTSYETGSSKTKVIFVPMPISTPSVSPSISKSTGYMPAEMISLNSMSSRMSPIHQTSRS